MYGIRGAITIEKNQIEDIKEASIELFNSVIMENNIKIDDIVTIIFSCTKDITKAYPGKFIREHFNLGLVALMHFNEMDVENSLTKCIRILVLANGEKKDIKYVYLRDAKSLRKDLIK